MTRKRITSDDFIHRARALHGNKYDYSNAEYTGVRSKVEIMCLEHGSFWVTPNNHIANKSGCPGCARHMSGSTQRTVASQTFLEDCNKVHNFKYTYDDVEYINAHTKVRVSCPVHGTFHIAPYSHRQGQGCMKCGIATRSHKNTLTSEQFLMKSGAVHGNKYIYDYVDYVKSTIKVQIVCPHHGPFMQRPTQHMTGEGCPECGKYRWFSEQGGYSDQYFVNNPSEKQKRGMLYLLRFTSNIETFYKVGITTQTIKQRFHWGYAAYVIEVVKVSMVTIYEAWRKEQRIIGSFQHQQYIPTVKIGGYTECLSEHINIQDVITLMD